MSTPRRPPSPARVASPGSPRAAPRRRLPALGLLGAVLSPALSAASESAAGQHEPSKTLLLLAFINFGIYAYILRRFAWPPIVKYLRERRAGVVAALEAAARARAEAEAIKADFAARMRTLEADAERARAEVLAIAELEARQLLEQARLSAERIRRDARLVADQEVSRARRVLQEETAALVAQLAAGVVVEQLTGADQARFVAEFLADTRAEVTR